MISLKVMLALFECGAGCAGQKTFPGWTIFAKKSMKLLSSAKFSVCDEISLRGRCLVVELAVSRISALVLSNSDGRIR